MFLNEKNGTIIHLCENHIRNIKSQWNICHYDQNYLTLRNHNFESPMFEAMSAIAFKAL